MRYGRLGLFGGTILGLSLGMIVGTFVVIDFVILKSLPVSRPSELVLIGTGNDRGVSRSKIPQENLFSYPHFRELAKTIQVFSAVAAIRSYDSELRVAQTEEATVPRYWTGRIRLVSGGYFNLFDVSPMVGRLIAQIDDQPENAKVLVISYRCWQEQFNSDPNVVGRYVTIARYPYMIIGVTRKEFFGETIGREPDLWAPLSAQPALLGESSELESRTTYWLMILGRLKAHLPRATAEREIDGQFRRIIVEDVGESGESLTELNRIHLKLTSLERGLRNSTHTVAAILIIIITLEGLLFVGVCATLIGLLITRLESRLRELGIHLALGASRYTIVRLIGREAIAIFIIGGCTGVIVARYVLQYFVLAMVRLLGLELEVSFDYRAYVLLCSLALLCLGSMIIGLIVWTKIRIGRGNIHSMLQMERRGIGRRVVAVLQVGFCFSILYVAWLFGVSVHRLTNVDLGVDAGHIIQVRLDPFSDGVPRSNVNLFYDRVIGDLASLPGVDATSFSSSPILGSGHRTKTVDVEGQSPLQSNTAEPMVEEVTEDYFRTLGIPLLSGRTFVRSDRQDPPQTAVVNHAFVVHRLGGGIPVGASIRLGDSKILTTIVGEVGNVRAVSLDEAPDIVYVPISGDASRLGTLVIRTHLTSESMIGNVATILSRGISGVFPGSILPLREQVKIRSSAQISLENTALLLAFGSGCLMLASLYGLLSYTLISKRKGLCIRVALGAGPIQAMMPLFRESSAVFGLGLAFGIGSALGLAKLASAFLFGVRAADLPILISTVVTLCFLGFLVTCLPSFWTTRMDIAHELRHE